MKKIIALFITLAAFAACQDSIEDRAVNDAQELTRKLCPKQLNEQVTLLKASFDKTTRTWKQDYSYSLPNGGQLDEADFRAKLVENLKNRPEYQPYVEAGFLFQHVYCREQDMSDTLINITLRPEDYR